MSHATDPTRWEYARSFETIGDINALNKWGDDGWELVAIRPWTGVALTERGGEHVDRDECIWKRPKHNVAGT